MSDPTAQLQAQLQAQGKALAEATNRINKQQDQIELLEDTVESLLATMRDLHRMYASLQKSRSSPQVTPPTSPNLQRRDTTSISSPAPGAFPSPSHQTSVGRTTSVCGTSANGLVETSMLVEARKEAAVGKSGANLRATTTAEIPLYGLVFGYLYKLSTGFGSKNWNRRWFILKENGKLYYWKSAKASTDPEAEFGTIPLNGYFVEKTYDSSKNFVFKLSGGEKRTYVLSAESDADRSRWASALTEAIEKADEEAKEITNSLGKNLRLSVYVPEEDIPQLDSGPESLATCERHGWLFREGFNNTWKHLYFAIKDQILYYFTGPGEMSPLGHVFLSGFAAALTPHEAKANVFTVSQPGSRTIVLAADSDKDAAGWVAALTAAGSV